MVNALNPNGVLDDFRAQAEESVDRFSTLSLLAVGDASLPLRRALAGDAAFRLGSYWEIFQHRWHVAAISKRPEVFCGRIQQELTSGLEKGTSGHIVRSLAPEALTVPKRLKAAEIESLIDPDGYNLSFKDCRVWAERAAKDLAEVDADRVRSIVSDATDSSVVGLLKAIRNALAHSSSGSMQAFNRASRARPAGADEGLVGGANAPLMRETNQVRDIATYLNAWIPNVQRRRVDVLHTRICAVAERLRA